MVVGWGVWLGTVGDGEVSFMEATFVYGEDDAGGPEMRERSVSLSLSCFSILD